MKPQKTSIRGPSHSLRCCLMACSITTVVVGTLWGQPQESATFSAYASAWTQGEQAFAAGDYEAAAVHYETVTRIFPYEPMSRFRWACCLAKLAEPDRALAQLTVAVEVGWDDPAAIESSPFLAPLGGDDRLAECVAAATACRDEQWTIYPGKSVDPKRSTAVVVLLPGLGCGPRSEVPYWRPVADELQLILASPRGPTPLGPNL
jgi:hypothetical protein